MFQLNFRGSLFRIRCEYCFLGFYRSRYFVFLNSYIVKFNYFPRSNFRRTKFPISDESQKKHFSVVSIGILEFLFLSSTVFVEERRKPIFETNRPSTISRPAFEIFVPRMENPWALVSNGISRGLSIFGRSLGRVMAQASWDTRTLTGEGR